VVFGGPNGAGKTTHAGPLLRAIGIPTFVNADFIARGLGAQADDSVAQFAAGRIMLARLKELRDARIDFAFESTLASRTFVGFLGGCRRRGYSTSLQYYFVADADAAVGRVARRAALGGHSVPESDVRRRFSRSIDHLFSLYLPLFDEVQITLNADGVAPELVASVKSGTLTVISLSGYELLCTLRSTPSSKSF
jgi:predicted ABC-type ATPase